MEFITNETVSTLKVFDNGYTKLRFYREKKVIFEKIYKTLRTAKAMETKLYRKYMM